jgi:hypothetical protein
VITIPPPGYGGVERVVSALTEALVARGHIVTLFCAPGSRSSATVVTLLDEHFREGAACDVVVDGRTGFLVDDELAMANAVARLSAIAADCRAWVAEHCDVDAVALATFCKAVVSTTGFNAWQSDFRANPITGD